MRLVEMPQTGGESRKVLRDTLLVFGLFKEFFDKKKNIE